MTNRFIGSVVSSNTQSKTPFSSRSSAGTYFDNTGVLVTATSNQPRLNYTFNGQQAADRYSALFTSASSNYLSTVTAASNVGTGNFTMEFWWKANSTTQSNYSNIINQGFTGSPSNGSFSFKVFAGSGNNILNFTYYNGGISDNSTTANVNDLAWHHIAASRNGTSLGIYVDGVLNTTITLPSSFNMGASGGTTYIGYNPRDASYINGHVKDVRIITGQALYSGTFTPPTAPLTRTTVGSTGAGAAASLTGTVILLTCQTASLNDVSSNNYTITNTNSVAPNPALPNNLGIDTSGTGWIRPAVLIEPASTNFLTYSEDTSNGVWTNNNSNLPNQAVAPDGTTTADLVYPASTGSFQVRYQQNPTGTGTKITGYTFTISIFAKAAGKNWLFLGDDNTTTRGVWFNVSTGVIGTTGSGMLNGRIDPVGNGWYRCQVTYITNGVVRLLTAITDADNSSSVTASGTSGIYLWGAQLEERFTATSYIPTTTAGVTRAADIVGPGTSGVYKLEDRQSTTATDDQSIITSFTTVGSTTWTAPADVTSVEVLVVAGGGGGGSQYGGGGGAGGLLYNTSYPVVPGTTYPIAVGAGGTSGSGKGQRGVNSQFGNLIAIGGGGGGFHGENGGVTQDGLLGGSGGGGSIGGSGGNPATGRPGAGTPGQGFPGGTGYHNLYGGAYPTGGGGGASGAGRDAQSTTCGAGGNGLRFSISGTATFYAGGGGGGTQGSASSGAGGAGGGGAGSNSTATAGTANTGGGGGGGATGGAGGSGIVIIKFKRTPRQLASASNAAIVVQKFSTTNLWTVPVGVTSVEALVVAGGGGGGNGTAGGGGGAGGVVYSSALAVTPGSTYTIGVGGGGLGGLDQASLPSYNGFGSGIGTGAELVTNGSAFTTTTGWTATTATLSVPQTGTFRILPDSGVNGTASQSITTVNGVTYVAVVKVTSDVSKFFRLRIGTTQVGAEITDFFTAYTRDSLDNGTTGAGFYSTTFTATGSTTWINMQIGGGTQQRTDISYISVRQASLPAFGGGNGGSESGTAGHRIGGNGGSGGGGDYSNAGGTGVAGQGNAGGAGLVTSSGGNNTWTGGGGGGAGSAGTAATTYYPGYGGAGVAYAITGNLEYYGGGGGGSSQNYNLGTVYPGLGGIGGGGTGFADQTSSTIGKGVNGATNTGGGGGAQADVTGSGGSGNGGSGVVILRYRVPQVATFLDSGSWTCPSGVTSVQALIVAGGGGGGPPGGGGGGAGGLLYDNSIPVVPGVTYSVVVGQGGDGGVYNSRPGGNGQNSSFANLTAVGGGGAGGNSTIPTNGGSGGGTSGNSSPSTVALGTYGQGNSGGSSVTSSPYQTNGGGGGASGNGGLGNGSASGVGGAGLSYSISGTSTTYAGGGGGSGGSGGSVPGASGGSGGGGLGGTGSTNNPTPGLINTGGGGGGRGNGGDPGAHGGSGIVIIRWIGG